VQAASVNRIEELEEDHPWLQNLMSPFANSASVPMPEAVFDLDLSEAFGSIPDGIPGLSELLPKDLRRQGIHGLIIYLCQLGLLTQMKDERLNMPDIYLSHRLQAGPQRRHKAGSTHHCPTRLPVSPLPRFLLDSTEPSASTQVPSPPTMPTISVVSKQLTSSEIAQLRQQKRAIAASAQRVFSLRLSQRT
jgi:hypothetical protein